MTSSQAFELRDGRIDADHGAVEPSQARCDCASAAPHVEHRARWGLVQLLLEHRSHDAADCWSGYALVEGSLGAPERPAIELDQPTTDRPS